MEEEVNYGTENIQFVQQLSSQLCNYSKLLKYLHFPDEEMSIYLCRLCMTSDQSRQNDEKTIEVEAVK